MTSPSLVISTGSFFSGVSFEYSSLAVPGATVEGTNSILSISPSSIAAMRTLRANGEAGEKVSFMGGSKQMIGNQNVIARSEATKQSSFLCSAKLDCFASLAMTMESTASLRRNNLLPLLAKTLDAEGDDVADIEELRRFHAGADAGRRA